MMILKEIARVIEFVARTFLQMAPFFIFSVIIAAGINQLDFKEKMAAFMRRKALSAIFITTLIGAISPLCSCGVIAMIFALFQAGIPLAPIMSFWITSPIMSPEAFVLTWGKLGSELAVARLAATIIMGITTGLISLKLFPPDKTIPSWLKISLSEKRNNCGCNPESQKKRPLHLLDWGKFLVDLRKVTLFLGSWLALAFILEALIVFYLPPDLVKSFFSSQNIFSVIWAAVVGIPLYLNNISAIPIIDGLLQAGMGKGAALTFLLAGPVTTIPAMIAVFGLVKKKVFLTFLFLGFLLAILCGYLYQLLILMFNN